MTININDLLALGFDRDPFRRVQLETGDTLRVAAAVRMAVADQGMLVISGRRGLGKTIATETAVAAAADQHPKGLHLVRPGRVEVEYTRSSDLVNAIILHLAPAERPKMRREQRIMQLTRILGVASQEKPVVMIIEEAHALHPATLVSLKRLREVNYSGRYPLFAVVLIGQRDPMTLHRGMDEVRLRASSLAMQGLSQIEIETYIQQTVGRAMDAEASKAVTTMPAANAWLDLQAILTRAMSRCVAAGRTTINLDDVLTAEISVSPHGASTGRQSTVQRVMTEQTTNVSPASIHTVKAVIDKARAEREGRPTAQTKTA